jgi:ketosteroid isomerase-like protein
MKHFERRSFLQAAVAIFPLAMVGQAAPENGVEVPTQTETHGGATMSDLSPIVQKLLEESKRGLQAWVNGRADYAEMMSHAPDFTIAGPFGGAPIRGWSERSRTAQAQVASQFKGGTGDVELVASYETSDLIVLVIVERSQVKFGDNDNPQPWILRTTQVYRREGDKWLIVHRHADPLVEFRNLSETVALVAKREHY